MGWMGEMVTPACTDRRLTTPDKAMREGPGEVWRDQNERKDQNDEPPLFAQRLPRFGREHRLDGHTEREIDHGVFGKQTDPNAETEQYGPNHALALDQRGPEVERDCPKKQKRHIASDGRGEKTGQGQRGENNCGPETNTRSIKCAAGQKHEPARKREEHRRKAAEAGLALSAKFARAADQPGEQRGF